MIIKSEYFYIYKIINTINNKVYIGQTNNPSLRWSQHRSNARYCTGKTFNASHSLKISKSNVGRESLKTRKFSTEIENEICILYRDEEISTGKLGKKFGCGKSLIRDILLRNKITLRSYGSLAVESAKNRRKFSEEVEKNICDEYNSGNVSIQDLTVIFNCGRTTIRDILIRSNIIRK